MGTTTTPEVIPLKRLAFSLKPCLPAAARTLPFERADFKELSSRPFLDPTVFSVEVNEELRRDVEKRKQAEIALEIRSRDLQDMNAVLRALLKQREDDRREFEEKIPR